MAMPVTAEEKGPYLRIPLGKELLPRKTVTIELDFEATVPDQKQSSDLFSEAMEELRRLMDPKSQADTDYGVFSSGKDIVNLGLWYPILSKYDKDGWDEEKYSGIGDVSYFDPADFQVSITAPADYKVVTTGSEISRSPAGKSKFLYKIDAPMARDFEVELSRFYSEATRLTKGQLFGLSFCRNTVKADSRLWIARQKPSNISKSRSDLIRIRSWISLKLHFLAEPEVWNSPDW